ncbi:hypothetical protein ACJJTC_007785 [Scirpophaga incertulas]
MYAKVDKQGYISHIGNVLTQTGVDLKLNLPEIANPQGPIGDTPSGSFGQVNGLTHNVYAGLSENSSAPKTKRQALTQEWPNEPLFDVPVEPSDRVELKPSARINKSLLARLKSPSTASYNNVGKSPKPVAAGPSRFSSWLRMVRATARAHQFIAICITRVKWGSNNFILPQRNTLTSPLWPLNAYITTHADEHLLEGIRMFKTRNASSTYKPPLQTDSS